ncbi:amino acid/amide ABC transporter ATP-binding protein 2 (HAAT family) [Tepidamorphus gemmatus]|uniref:Amino acid/amide ABC transporter ATP-binding protein 2 (HAAT family) n=1 Tax=Tepidamorphus gemmatus TaxID=747076 RepID=A0A4R3MIK8_9HYPH|nr:ABC transporter ATP-binding protein [Tepidamorphus gemmatus]TCT11545.1 amino acid/amide ABC transporter ATP-binding protein 2 (HAAT family) [Tepidamorphus gemmatus]
MLELNDIVVRYGRREVIHGLSMKVGAGEVVTLVGSNGAGKTTTLKTISGLLRPVSGTITFAGERIDTAQPHEIIARGVVHVPEGRLLFPDMTVREHIELGGIRAHVGGRSHAERVDWVHELFPILQERRDQKAGTLSGGQQQMLAIARGLMANPRCLMLDEPSLGLAPIMVDLLADTIRNLHEAGITILLVEQRVDLALRLAHRGYVLETGRIVIEDSADVLLQDPRVKAAYLGA